jgi:hypothetical protein
LEKVFKEKFNFKTEQYEIPPIETETSLFNRLQAFKRCYDSPSKLGIIYYGGHAERKETENGVDLELFARRSSINPAHSGVLRANTSLSDFSLPNSPVDGAKEVDMPAYKLRPEQSHVSFRAICEKMGKAETDMLLIVDSCYAAGAFTDQPFGGRKCELFCSIAEKDWARAPGMDGSFTKILTNTLENMIQETPEGFSTSDLYRRVYQQQHQTRKPFHFTNSRFDFGRIWLRPCSKKTAAIPNDSEWSIDVRFHFTKSLDMTELNTVVKALQWIPFVQMVRMQSMRSPSDKLKEFIRTAYLANRLRPVLARVRRKLELQRARQLCRTDSIPSSASSTTSERFHMHEPRDVGLFDYSNAQAVTRNDARLTSDQYFHPMESSGLHIDTPGTSVAVEAPDQLKMADAALEALSREKSTDTPAEHEGTFWQRATNMRMSQRTMDGMMFFGLGVLAPTIAKWVMQGSASTAR